MGKTRLQIKNDIKDNLNDLSINFYSDSDIHDSIQDAYDDIAVLTQCIQKETTLNWISKTNYLRFNNDYAIQDYLGTTAIFNNVTKRWLRDDLSLKDFDKIRKDWENWEGSPQFWAPSDPLNVVVAPRYENATGSFNLHYWATAPTLSSDDDTFLIATDMEGLLVDYVTADLLEQAQEFTKAGGYWIAYYEAIISYADRVKRNCKSDLLLRI